jgi:hypothetical protein
MIQDDQAMKSAHEALLDLFLSLAALNRKRATLQAGWYEAMAEPLLEHIFRLRRDLDHYLGLPPEWPADQADDGEQTKAEGVNQAPREPSLSLPG